MTFIQNLILERTLSDEYSALYCDLCFQFRMYEDTQPSDYTEATCCACKDFSHWMDSMEVLSLFACSSFC